MAIAKFHCLNCDKDFEAGNWYCSSGEPHTVPEKTYYVRDAPVDKRDCKNARLQMLNVIPESKVILGGDTHVVPGTHVEFVRGMYSTSNPQLQMNLDKRPHVASGDAGKVQWEQDYFSNEEKNAMALIAQNARIVRLENENNKLLQQVQNQKKVAIPA